MTSPGTLRYTKIPLAHGTGAMPAVGFGTLIPASATTKQAAKTALEVGFRHFDCAERYRNEEAVIVGWKTIRPITPLWAAKYNFINEEITAP